MIHWKIHSSNKHALASSRDWHSAVKVIRTPSSTRNPSGPSWPFLGMWPCAVCICRMMGVFIEGWHGHKWDKAWFWLRSPEWTSVPLSLVPWLWASLFLSLCHLFIICSMRGSSTVRQNELQACGQHACETYTHGACKWAPGSWNRLLLLSRFSHVQLCATPSTAVHQAPPSLGFSRQEYWSGMPFCSPTHACMLSCFGHVPLYATLWTAAYQAPLSTGFTRQEYWNGLPFPSPGTDWGLMNYITCLGLW